MPIYEYRPTGDDRCDFCSGGFETIRKISDAKLDRCPRCGAPVERVISAPNVGGTAGPSLDAGNIEKHGFTQYKRAGKGVYEKTAGKGPKVISDD